MNLQDDLGSRSEQFRLEQKDLPLSLGLSEASRVTRTYKVPYVPCVPQLPLNQPPGTTEAKYGYVGPGIYRIISYSSNYAVSLNTSESTTGIVSMPLEVDNDAQKWLITNVSETEKTIINDGTKAILTALRGNDIIFACSNTIETHLLSQAINPHSPPRIPPYELFDHWVMDFERYSDFTNAPVMITNVGKKNTALDLTDSRQQAGTPVLS
ncbi:MAG: hypothetical protein Q9174_004871 [Haloplaca sp. 1 TL-2023]